MEATGDLEVYLTMVSYGLRLEVMDTLIESQIRGRDVSLTQAWEAKVEAEKKLAKIWRYIRDSKYVK